MCDYECVIMAVQIQYWNNETKRIESIVYETVEDNKPHENATIQRLSEAYRSQSVSVDRKSPPPPPPPPPTRPSPTRCL